MNRIIRNLIKSAPVLFMMLSLTAGAGAQEDGCGTILTPEQIAFELSFDPQGPLSVVDDTTVYYIPVSFHVVNRTDGTGGLSESRLNQTLLDLNTNYASVGIRFFRFRDDNQNYITYNINDDGFYFGTSTFEMFNALRTHDPVPNTANIWFVPGTGLCGLSSFSGSFIQGTIMDNACTGLSGNPSTIAHELGHYFNLYHTHETAFGVECPDGTNCSIAGDLLCDTPADPTLSGNVGGACAYTGPTSAPAPCTGTYDPQTENLMSYSIKACRDLFTPQQISKARATLVNLRSNLFLFDSTDNDSDGVFDVADNCVQINNPNQIDADNDGLGDACLHAQIDLDSPYGSIPHEVAFTGASDLTVIDWMWEFGDGGVSTLQSPVHTYTEPGFHQTRLTVQTADTIITASRFLPVVSVADTIVGSTEDVVGAGGQVVVEVYARNTVAVRQIQIPFSWSGSFDLSFVSWSTNGLRTEYFDVQKLVTFDPFGKRAAISLISSNDNSLPLLVPDTGVILRLTFNVVSISGESSPITIAPIAGADLFIATDWGILTPPAIDGQVQISYVCGDADGSQSITIADATFLIAMIFSGGAPAVPPEAGDANGSGSINISDATYLIAYIFSGGAAPVCPGGGSASR